MVAVCDKGSQPVSKSLFLPEVGFVREPVVLAHVGVGRTKWRELVKAGEAPSPQKWSERISVYSAADIRRWIAERTETCQRVAA